MLSACDWAAARKVSRADRDRRLKTSYFDRSSTSTGVLALTCQTYYVRVIADHPEATDTLNEHLVYDAVQWARDHGVLSTKSDRITERGRNPRDGYNFPVPEANRESHVFYVARAAAVNRHPEIVELLLPDLRLVEDYSDLLLRSTRSNTPLLTELILESVTAVYDKMRSRGSYVLARLEQFFDDTIVLASRDGELPVVEALREYASYIALTESFFEAVRWYSLVRDHRELVRLLASNISAEALVQAITRCVSPSRAGMDAVRVLSNQLMLAINEFAAPSSTKTPAGLLSIPCLMKKSSKRAELRAKEGCQR
ncbi:hypothetical protein PHYSODRAFT_342723 [Phytophthora sojae]|uniref:Uncharacterized protein n=1 Tax=Phytophthora sojae (strain P6497) TaxID=1094619 RepID=G5AHG0_PHYSP|nr:hypothetical protein PHYSODRAFT_342723 [Phytophthora sojae]EGZ05002.1 hypothetical protein PHYSODRAFT_342723 [Phytophthora sojae]|eukprot:XP_009539511.1 hypothetical protein PHYSODRAFT_342723 [Phytophthora sojae]